MFNQAALSLALPNQNNSKLSVHSACSTTKGSQAASILRISRKPRETRMAESLVGKSTELKMVAMRLMFKPWLQRGKASKNMRVILFDWADQIGVKSNCCFLGRPHTILSSDRETSNALGHPSDAAGRLLPAQAPSHAWRPCQRRGVLNCLAFLPLAEGDQQLRQSSVFPGISHLAHKNRTENQTDFGSSYI